MNLTSSKRSGKIDDPHSILFVGYDHLTDGEGLVVERHIHILFDVFIQLYHIPLLQGEDLDEHLLYTSHLDIETQLHILQKLYLGIDWIFHLLRRLYHEVGKVDIFDSTYWQYGVDPLEDLLFELLDTLRGTQIVGCLGK